MRHTIYLRFIFLIFSCVPTRARACFPVKKTTTTGQTAVSNTIENLPITNNHAHDSFIAKVKSILLPSPPRRLQTNKSNLSLLSFFLCLGGYMSFGINLLVPLFFYGAFIYAAVALGIAAYIIGLIAVRKRQKLRELARSSSILGFLLILLVFGWLLSWIMNSAG